MLNFENKPMMKHTSTDEHNNRSKLLNCLKQSPVPDEQLLSNLGLYLESKNLARILFMDHIFQQIVGVQGVVMEFGTRWGQNLALFSALRGIHDPFNRHRKIIGFDTFTGFSAVSEEDGRSEIMKPGEEAVVPGYENYLHDILECHERANPLSHIKKFELCKGDGPTELVKYLKREPQTIIALAYFDFDLYQPTKKCLEAIRPHLTRGSIVAFDELNDPDSPGETTALKEVFGLSNVRIRRFPKTSRTSYLVIE